MGILQWSPDVFWAATPHELWAAVSGWRVANGIEEKAGPPSQDEIDALKARFPD